MSLEELERIFSPVLMGLGYYLYGVEASSGLLQFFIEKSDYTSVTIDDCVFVSQQLSHLLPVENIDYDNLEVSSPGMDRPLRRLEHFHRYQGEVIKIQLYRSLSSTDRHNFKGILRNVTDQTIQLQIDSDQVLEFSFKDIQKARLIPQWRGHKDSV